MTFPRLRLYRVSKKGLREALLRISQTCQENAIGLVCPSISRGTMLSNKQLRLADLLIAKFGVGELFHIFSAHTAYDLWYHTGKTVHRIRECPSHCSIRTGQEFVHYNGQGANAALKGHISMIQENRGSVYRTLFQQRVSWRDREGLVEWPYYLGDKNLGFEFKWDISVIWPVWSCDWVVLYYINISACAISCRENETPFDLNTGAGYDQYVISRLASICLEVFDSWPNPPNTTYHMLFWHGPSLEKARASRGCIVKTPLLPIVDWMKLVLGKPHPRPEYIEENGLPTE